MKRFAPYDTYVTTHYAYVAPATMRSFRKRYYVWKSYLSHSLPFDPKSRILEIGAGVGHNLYALKELGYTHCTGTDYSRECVRISKTHGFRVEHVDSRSEKKFYGAHARTFDCIILYDVLEHYDPADASVLLGDIRSMLRPGGRVIISVPNANHPFSNTLLFADITHKWIYNELSASQLLRTCGFTNVTIRQMNSFSLYDDNPLLHIFKITVVRVISGIGEVFWKCIALSQGIWLAECKPTLLIEAHMQ